MISRIPSGPAGAYLAGLVSGIALCAAIALFITNAPVPFVSKVQRATENINPEPVDPNQSLYSPQIPAGQPAAPPGTAIAGSTGSPAAPAPAPAASGAPAPAIAAAPAAGPAAGAASAPGAPHDAPGPSGRMLQTGAFRNADDADAMRARLALLGLDARVSSAATAEGATVFRVRLGPFGQLDDLNGIRRTLSENGIEAQEVHAR
jgi:cell division protein FtsN